MSRVAPRTPSGDTPVLEPRVRAGRSPAGSHARRRAPRPAQETEFRGRPGAAAGAGAAQLSAALGPAALRARQLQEQPLPQLPALLLRHTDDVQHDLALRAPGGSAGAPAGGGGAPTGDRPSAPSLPPRGRALRGLRPARVAIDHPHPSTK